MDAPYGSSVESRAEYTRSLVGETHLLSISKSRSAHSRRSRPAVRALSIFQLNRAIQTFAKECGLAERDPLSVSILFFIGGREENGQRTTVSDVTKLREFGTPPTVHNRLSQLLECGWIESSGDPNDGRVRLIGLSKKARRDFDKMSDRVKTLFRP